MPEEVRARLVEAVDESGRSLNREIVDRFDRSLSRAPEGVRIVS